MDRPQVFYSGEGARGVYFAKLSEKLAIKIGWNGEHSFVESASIPTKLANQDIPRPVADLIAVAYQAVQNYRRTSTSEQTEAPAS